MDLKKYNSRKLLLTLLVLVVVASADLLGVPLDQATLDSMVTMAQTLVGGQAIVDTAAAFRMGSSIAHTARVGKELVDEGVSDR